jgi:adenosylcobyric acid synthase
VRPFKPQNMSNNAAVTADGGEIGRAQALQARAAGVAPSVHMNPVLLKPETDAGAQVVLHGRRVGTARAADYRRLKPELMAGVMESFARVGEGADLVLVEGAGSPAEVNLRLGDIANMGFAAAARVPVVLAADIDRGGVIAQVVGTHAVVAPEDGALIKGFLINKFRGDARLFDEGYRLIEARTGWRGFGVVPWFAEAARLPAEDAADIRPDAPAGADGAVRIVCLQLSRIANFDDLDPLRIEPGVTVSMVRAGEAVPGDADLVIVPGSKSTRGDLDYLRLQGWDVDLMAHRRRGGRILGLCGGYQILGERLTNADVEGTGARTEVEGVGVLPVETCFETKKRVERVTRAADGAGPRVGASGTATGYEIHMGRSSPTESVARPLGPASAATDRALGTYLHGLFENEGVREAFVERVFAAAGKSRPATGSNAGDGSAAAEADDRSSYDRAADLVADNVDLDALGIDALALEDRG